MRKPKVKTAPTPPAEANPETIKKSNPERAGLGELFHDTYAERPRSEVLSLTMKASALFENERTEREEMQESLRNRNRAGAVGKAKASTTRKNIVRQVYAVLLANYRKKPALKTLLKELDASHSGHRWRENTIRKWVAKLNKGEAI